MFYHDYVKLKLIKQEHPNAINQVLIKLKQYKRILML